MKYHSLILPVTGVVVSLAWSTAWADYFVVSQRTSNFVTINSQAYDKVSLGVYNDGTNGTAPASVGFPSVDALAVALFAPLHGMLISVNGTSHQPDIFGANGEASLPNSSWINGNTWAGFSNAPGQEILNGSGSNYSVDQANGSGAFSGTYADLSPVAGISGDFFTTNSASWPNIGPTAASAKTFGQVVVQHGDPVFIIPPTSSPYNRTFPSTTWEPSATSFGVPNAGASGILAADNTPGVLPGDANLNGAVDLGDYNLVVRNFGTGTTWTQGDFDAAPTVDLADYNVVVRNFGRVSSAASPAAGGLPAALSVPEPTAVGTLALVLTIVRRHGQRTT